MTERVGLLGLRPIPGIDAISRADAVNVQAKVTGAASHSALQASLHATRQGDARRRAVSHLVSREAHTTLLLGLPRSHKSHADDDAPRRDPSGRRRPQSWLQPRRRR